MTRDAESRQQQQQQQPQPQQEENANLDVGGNFPHFLRDIGVAAAAARRNVQQRQVAELDYEMNEDGIIEGGVAVPVPASVAHYLGDDSNAGGVSGGGLRRSTECDLVLFLECSEDLQSLTNSIAKRGTTISIGLEKTTKLSAVFNRFVEFVTEKSHDKESLSITDLEFVHNEILSGKDTTESSSLMKDDRIKVRRQRQHLRDEKMERQLMQRDSDRIYFKHLRSLLTDTPSPTGDFDVVFDCKGQLLTECHTDHDMELTPSSLVKAHSTIILRRCTWLGDKIRKAKEEKRQKMQNKNTAYEHSDVTHKPDIVPRMVSQTHRIENSSRIDDIADDVVQIDATSRESLDISPSGRVAISNFVGDGVSFDVADFVDDDDAVRPYPLGQDNTERISSGAAEVVAEDDDISLEGGNLVTREGRPINSPVRCMQSNKAEGSDQSTSNMLWVTLEDHHPKAVKLLLEYSCTNRCIPLGYDAFFQSSKGAVSPVRVLTGNYKPTISMPLAMAAIKLAEDAGISRFSLMCEIAASTLVTKATVLDALSLCSTQQVRSGNRLPILRKSAISLLLHRPVLMELTTTAQFVNTLSKESDDVVPSLLLGTNDVIPTTNLKRKRGSSNAEYLSRCDAEDRVARNIERHLQRGKRNNSLNNDDESISYSGTFLLRSFNDKSKKRSSQEIE